MTDDNLLPVPPNCPYFSECDEGPDEPKSVHFEIHGSDVTILKGDLSQKRPQIIQECLCHCSPVMRPVIAAIARCAWLDMPFPADEVWENGGDLVAVYEAWLQSKALTKHMTHQHGKCEATWASFCEHMALRCKQWGLK